MPLFLGLLVRLIQFAVTLREAFLQRFYLGHHLSGSTFSSGNQGVDIGASETGGAVFRDVDVDIDVALLDVLDVLVCAAHVNHVRHQVQQVLVPFCHGDGRYKVTPDDDVGPHPFGQIHGKVVGHKTIHKEHGVLLDGSEHSRNGH